jgi:hypothetical protein
MSMGKYWHVGSGSLVLRLLRLRTRIPSGAWMFVSCECCALLGRELCDGSIAGPEESLPSIVCLSAIEEPHCGCLDTLVLLGYQKKLDTLHILLPYKKTNVKILRASLVIKNELEGMFICCRHVSCLVFTGNMLSSVSKHFVIEMYWSWE